MKRLFLIPILFSLTVLSLSSASVLEGNIRFHNEQTDTTRINEILVEAVKIKNPQTRVASIGRKFIGTPYVGHTLEGEKEVLTVNLDELDCTTFVETVLALAFTAGEGRTSWRDFVYNLENIRYRNGQLDGYPSRLHYICNWIVDNAHRGVLEEATTKFPDYSYVQRSICFMSENRDRYESLKDSANFEKIKNIELGYANHRFPYIKSGNLNKKEIKNALKDGDAIALVCSLKNLDVTHMGLVVKEQQDAEPYLLHASSSNGKVEISSVPLAEFMKRNRSLMGIRVIRLKE